MKKEYFINRDEMSYIPFWERLQLFFEKMHHFDDFSISNEYAAFNLIQQSISTIEMDAFVHNEKVKKLTQNAELSLREMMLPRFLSWVTGDRGLGFGIYGTSTTNQYLLIDIHGAIEIHQKIENHAIFGENAHLYRENIHDSLILKRPGRKMMDIWGRYLPAPVEEYSLRPGKQGRIKIQQHSLDQDKAA